MLICRDSTVHTGPGWVLLTLSPSLETCACEIDFLPKFSAKSTQHLTCRDSPTTFLLGYEIIALAVEVDVRWSQPTFAASGLSACCVVEGEALCSAGRPGQASCCNTECTRQCWAVQPPGQWGYKRDVPGAGQWCRQVRLQCWTRIRRMCFALHCLTAAAGQGIYCSTSNLSPILQPSQLCFSPAHTLCCISCGLNCRKKISLLVVVV